MISFKDHSLALFGVWYQGVMFAPEGESSSRALFSVVVTWSTDSPTQYMVVSSAHRNVVAVLTVFGRSLVYKAKSMGPSTEPCGIPCATLVYSEGTPLITVYCSRSDR